MLIRRLPKLACCQLVSLTPRVWCYMPLSYPAYFESRKLLQWMHFHQERRISKPALKIRSWILNVWTFAFSESLFFGQFELKRAHILLETLQFSTTLTIRIPKKKSWVAEDNWKFPVSSMYCITSFVVRWRRPLVWLCWNSARREYDASQKIIY